MAGAGQIPFSNPAGNNQMSPIGSKPPTAVGAPINTPHGNPYQMPTAVPQQGGMPHAFPGAASTPLASTTGIPTPPTSGSQGFITNASSYANGENDLQKQLIDIYGKGVGGSLFSLLNGMSGTNSQIMQEFMASLQPQMASAQANTNAALGAGGVGANSSVAAIADASLNAQETGAIAGEEAKLTQSQEALTADLLTNMKGDASKEVATSGWSVFADVMGAISQDAGAIIHGGPGYSPGSKPASSGGTNFSNMTPAQISGATSYTGDGSSISPVIDNSGYDIPFE